VTTGGDTTQVIALDAERVGWIASDTTIYLKTFITLYGTLNGSDSIRTIQSTNWIHFAAFITFNLASDVLSAEEEADTSDIGILSVSDTTLAIGSTADIYLDSVFVPPTGKEVKDLYLAATTSHAGIATATILTPGGVKVVRVLGVAPGTARITTSADDDLDDDVDPATTSFLVTVQQAGSESISPVPLPSIRHKVKEHARLW